MKYKSNTSKSPIDKNNKLCFIGKKERKKEKEKKQRT